MSRSSSYTFVPVPMGKSDYTLLRKTITKRPLVLYEGVTVEDIVSMSLQYMCKEKLFI